MEGWFSRSAPATVPTTPSALGLPSPRSVTVSGWSSTSLPSVRAGAAFSSSFLGRVGTWMTCTGAGANSSRSSSLNQPLSSFSRRAAKSLSVWSSRAGSPVWSQPVAAWMASSTPSGRLPGRSSEANSAAFRLASSSSAGMPSARMPSTARRTAAANCSAVSSVAPRSTSSRTGCSVLSSKPTSISAPSFSSSRAAFSGDWLVPSSASSKISTPSCRSRSAKAPVYHASAHCTSSASGFSV